MTTATRPADATDDGTGGADGDGPEVTEQDRRRRALKQSVADMLRTMAVIVAIVGLIVLLVPRPSTVPQERVDVSRAAQGTEGRLGFRPAVPRLPQGWVPTGAEVRNGADGLVTWHVGYLTPSERQAALEQTNGWTFGWQNSLTSGGEKVGTVRIGERSWDHIVREDRSVTALLLRVGERTTLVTSKTGGLEEARTLAASLPAASLADSSGS